MKLVGKVSVFYFRSFLGVFGLFRVSCIWLCVKSNFLSHRISFARLKCSGRKIRFHFKLISALWAKSDGESNKWKVFILVYILFSLTPSRDEWKKITKYAGWIQKHSIVSLLSRTFSCSVCFDVFFWCVVMLIWLYQLLKLLLTWNHAWMMMQSISLLFKTIKSEQMFFIFLFFSLSLLTFYCHHFIWFKS